MLKFILIPLNNAFSMKKATAFALTLCLTLSSHVLAGAPIDNVAINWQIWQSQPVQNGGLQKPLDTLAWETLLLTSNLTSVVDSETGQQLNPTALYLTMFFEWTGWDHERKDSLLLSKDWGSQYFFLHQADRWDKTPLLRVDFPELKQMIGMPEHVTYVAPAILATASIVDPRTQRSTPFPAWGRALLESKEAGNSLSQLEAKGLELANRLVAYQTERMGMGLGIMPGGKADDTKWLSVGELLLTKFDDSNDPQGHYRLAQTLLWQARSAFRGGDVKKFNLASEELGTVLRTSGSTLQSYPSEFKIDLEVAYNHLQPFHFAWVLMMLATVAMLLHLGSNWTMFYWSALGSYGLGMAALLVGFSIRVMISGRPPVTNMYESVIYVGFGVAVFGLVFAVIYRRKYVLTVATAVTTIALVLADHCPGILDPSVRPLDPVLRSNFFLLTHVMTITLSYAAFALALGIANVTLGYFLLRSDKVDSIRALSQFTYRATQVGVLLLAAGIILGGVWADYSWGRFWGWDPKEVWALVALLGYLSVLHVRLGGAVGHRGFAVMIVVCFSLVVMAWYGVNFVLGTGLHSYGFGDGGQGFVFFAIFFQWLYAGIAIHRSRADAILADSLRDSNHMSAPRPVFAGRVLPAPSRG